MRTFSAIAKKCRIMVDTLRWQTYHTPENLASILVGEVGELSELCVWLTKEQIAAKKDIRQHIMQELADVIKATIFLYNSLHIDVTLETLLAAKLTYEDARYPVSGFKGVSKYEKLTVEERKKVKAQALPKEDVSPLPTIKKLEKWAWDNSRKREWEKYYTPAALCLGISEDCSKIYTSFQRRTTIVEDSYNKLVWAIAGILILTLRLHTYLELDDYAELVLAKIEGDLARFG